MIAEGLQVFIIMAGMAVPIGVAIIGQGLILDEKKSGTLEWVLSKPASRTALLASKLIASAIGIVVVLVALQGALAYVQLALKGSPLAVLPFIGAMALVALNALFYLALTLMLGVLVDAAWADHRDRHAPDLRLPDLPGDSPLAGRHHAWGLVVQGQTPPLAVLVAEGQPLPTVLAHRGDRAVDRRLHRYRDLALPQAGVLKSGCESPPDEWGGVPPLLRAPLPFLCTINEITRTICLF